MYFPLVLAVVVVALWLAGSVLFGWSRRLYGAFAMLVSLGAVGGLALAVLMVAGPYWKVVYDTLIQPG